MYTIVQKNIYIDMETTTIQKKRKNIDLPVNTFWNLSIKAASEGTNLKSFIEQLLIMEANMMSDEHLYHFLVENKPEGNVYLNAAEQNEFENWLGI